jgi:hypothetical protein
MLVLNLDKTPEGIPLTIEEMVQRAIQNIGSNVIGPETYLLYKEQFDSHGKLKSDAWFASETEIKKQTPKLGWQFVSPNILPNSTNKNYLDQTELLIQNAKEKFFHNNFPPEYQQAEEEFQQEKDKIAELIKNSKYIEASKILTNLNISKLLREPTQNTIFRYLMSYKKGKQLFTDGKYSWSNSVSSDGRLLSFGFADAAGAYVVWFNPDYSLAHLGVVSSRF